MKRKLKRKSNFSYLSRGIHIVWARLLEEEEEEVEVKEDGEEEDEEEEEEEGKQIKQLSWRRAHH